MRNPRDYPMAHAAGFPWPWSAGDLDRAISYWKEAEPLGDSPIHFAYHKYLQARALEVQSRFDAAMALYKEAKTLCPLWIEPLYRQAVCMVKMGFSEHAVALIDQLVDDDPNMFNRIIIDPEAERGVVHILSSLHTRWVVAEQGAKEGADSLKKLVEEVEDWFGKDHEYNQQMQRRISAVLNLSEVERLCGLPQAHHGQEHGQEVAQGQRVKRRSPCSSSRPSASADKLKHIHGEIAWFPFPRTLRGVQQGLQLLRDQAQLGPPAALQGGQELPQKP